MKKEYVSMRFCMLAWFLSLILVSFSIRAQNMSTQIDGVLKQYLPHATIGILVEDLQTGEVIYSKNPRLLLAPASSAKLYTAAAALYQLHPDYHFVTTLARKDQNFYLKFTGAPDFTPQQLSELIDHLNQAGIHTIQGNIVLDISRFEAPYYPGGVSYDDMGWYYSAPETALILNENAVAYDFISTQIGKPIQIKARTSEQELSLINQIVTVSQEDEKERCSFNIEVRPHNTLRLFGCLAQAPSPTTMRLAVPDPVFLATQLIKKNLKKNNIVLRGKILLGDMPANAQPLATIASQNLSQLIIYMLQNSDNLYANSLARTLGYSLTKIGSNKAGAFAINHILAQHSQVNLAEVEIADGIGTRYNLTTPQQMVVLLKELYQNKTLRPIILRALPQMAVSGSLASRMKKTALEKIVFAKTGTMHDMSSLSGYLMVPHAHPLVFTIITNGVNVPISTVKMVEEKVLLSILKR